MLNILMSVTFLGSAVSKFLLINSKGKELRYTPDFFLPETSQYIEIKGYKVPKDEAKWEQFPKDAKLKILMKQDLKDLNII